MKISAWVGLVCGVVLCGSATTPVPAANINMNAGQCEPFDPALRNLLVHDSVGVRTADDVATPVTVSCALPRMALLGNETIYQFWFDGDNRSGAQTPCTVSAYEFTGTFIESASINATAATYDAVLDNVPFGPKGRWAYTAVVCQLAAHGTATLRGITWVSR
jgi:hypothetical protein